MKCYRNTTVIVNGIGGRHPIINKFGVTHFSSSPASPDLFKHDPLEDKKIKGDLNLKFLSAVMTASWVAKTKPEILLAVSYLSSRVTKVTPRDWIHLHRLMGYINFTKSHKLTLAPKSLNVVGWTDASYAVHPECAGQSGIVCGLGDNDESNINSSPNVQSLFHASTNKQKFIHSSSAGAELDAQVEGIKYMVWAREVMKQLGFEQKGPSVLFQDNKSAIIMGNDGKGSFKNSKHMHVRLFFAKQYIDDKILKLIHCPTKIMVADIITKPLQASLLRQLRSALKNNKDGLVAE